MSGNRFSLADLHWRFRDGVPVGLLSPNSRATPSPSEVRLNCPGAHQLFTDRTNPNGRNAPYADFGEPLANVLAWEAFVAGAKLLFVLQEMFASRKAKRAIAAKLTELEKRHLIAEVPFPSSEQPYQHGKHRSQSSRMQKASDTDAIRRTARLTGFEKKKEGHWRSPCSRARGPALADIAR
jgi:hypothetical protein